ncbi:tetratricopeptide repeat protein [Salipiger sp. IMCC34102]|nr:tetratricopeptide repeat protein [Salipiger sp. IMCC34102]
MIATLVALAPAASAQTIPEGTAGAYLAARNAAAASDFEPAARYFGEALQGNPDDPQLLESAAISHVALNQFDRAEAYARRLAEADIASQVGSLVRVAAAAKAGRWDDILSPEKPIAVSPLFDSLAEAWAMVGAGDMTRALEAFDEVSETEGMRSYGLLHKGLAFGTVGDFEGALEILSDPGDGTVAFSPRAAIAQAQMLSQLDRNEAALELLDEVFGATVDPGITDLRDRLQAGASLPYDVVPDAAAGVAETAFMIGSLLASEAREEYILLYARAAQHLNPAHIDAILLSAELLQQMDRFELASDTFAQVPTADPAYPAAELGRVDNLVYLEQTEAAIEVADALARSHPDLPFVQSRLGDVLRGADRFDDAYDAYSRAIDLYPASDPNLWIIHYSRAIAAFDMDDWTAAEADFRRALELEPGRPEVLNFLGYSLVERGEKLDEALDMIERAVEARPQSGAIIDSLGWVYFKLGRYRDAVEPLESAAALEATDPVVNDHLGDAYWAVGRRREARFQWQRALSFDPDEDLATRIRAKLSDGLDAVREAEGEPPITLAEDTAE